MPSGRMCPACGQTLLSRYNPDPLCGPCMRAARAAPEELTGPPAGLWDSRPWREALARVDLPAALAVFRAAAGLSQYQLADITGWSQSTLSLFEGGRRATLYDIRVWLQFADAVGMPREALLPLVLGRADAAAPDGGAAAVPLTAGGLEGTGLDVDRRSFGGLAAGAAASVLLTDTAPSRVSVSHVRHLRSSLERLRDGDRNRGGGAFLRQALRFFCRARQMLDDSDYTEAVGRQLLSVAADFGVIAGWLAYDSGAQRLARQVYSEAQLLAGSGDDDEVAAHVYANMAQQATYLARTTGRLGFAREALRYTERAADRCRHMSSPRLDALIAIRRALALAHLGDEPSFRSAIWRARRELDGGDTAAGPAWARFVSESEITGYEAMGEAALGAPRRAATLYRAALAGLDRFPRNRAYYQARLAAALLEEGDRANAVAEALIILPDMGSRLTSTRTLRELRPLRAAAEEDSGSEFCERFDAAARMLRAEQ